MNYVSTRNNQINFSSEQVLNYGLAPDGGLFIPSELPKFSSEDINNLKNADYKEIAYFVLDPFCIYQISNQIEIWNAKVSQKRK